jgi:RimJ/RimL family protein N-acetyltransferase
MKDFTIRPYAFNDADAAKLAVMWNESDDQWPGTFTDGVPLTAQRVSEWMAREAGLAMWVVDDPAQERIVGYGSLWDEADKEKTCYVALLNVHPAYQGQSLARRVLTRMVDKAVELGYEHMTIETWPGNLKSVPLYKKVGFFWTPDTNVHMDNYVPLIRRLAVARRYFERHDWYSTLRRELQQVEDDQQHGEIKIYRYHWAEDGDSLTVLIDREAHAITALETERFAAYAELDQTKPAHGLPYTMRWRVLNKLDQPVNVSLLADGAEGIDIAQQNAFVLPGGQERVIQGQFTVSPDIQPVRKELPAPRIKTVLVVGGDVVELGTGLRPRPPVQVSLEPAYPTLLPGQPQTVHVQLHNQLDRALSGVVSLAPQAGLSADWEGLRHSFELDAQGYAGLPLTVTCDAARAVPLRLSALLDVNGDQVRTRPERVPLFSLPPGGVVSDVGGDGEQDQYIVAENEFFQLRCRSRGGRCAVWNKVVRRAMSSIREELGPPFVPSELWEKPYDLSLERGAGLVKAVLHAQSRNFPGLTLSKELTMSASPLLTLRYRLVNEGAQAHTVKLNPRIWFGEREAARITLPRAERLVHERAGLFPSAHGDMPEKPEGLAERWLAWRVDDFVVGLTWDETVEEHKWGWSDLRLNRPALTLEPGDMVEIAPLYLYAGPGDWPDVRRAWKRLAGQPAREQHPLPRPGRKLEFGFDPAPVLTLNGQTQAALRVDNVRELPVDGRLIVEPPQGWRAEPAEFALQELKHGQPLEATVRLQATGDKIGAFNGQLRLESSRFDASEPFTLIRLGDEAAPVRVDETTQDGQQLFVIDNGRNRWQIAPGYQAGVIGWYKDQSDVNHLRSAFPQEGGAAMSWLKPWFGGIHPILVRYVEEGHSNWPGKLHEEQFAGQACQRSDARGLEWRGVCLSAQVSREEFRGLRAEVEYLTLGRSNLLQVVYRVLNETDVYRRVEHSLLAFCQVDGRYDNGTLYGDGFQRKRTPVMAWNWIKRWGAVSNPGSGRALILVNGTAGATLEAGDWGQDGGHLSCFKRPLIPPQGQSELVAFLALDDSLDAAQRYAALAEQ